MVPESQAAQIGSIGSPNVRKAHPTCCPKGKSLTPKVGQAAILKCLAYQWYININGLGAGRISRNGNSAKPSRLI
jgi:hypothetical protein